MSRVEVVVTDARNLKVGDYVVEFTHVRLGVNDRRRPDHKWRITRVDGAVVSGEDRDGWARSLYTADVTRWVVERDGVGEQYALSSPGGWTREYLGSPAPAKKVVEDWPCTCPRCGAPKSAVLLFSSWDCRKGCYK